MCRAFGAARRSPWPLQSVCASNQIWIIPGLICSAGSLEKGILPSRQDIVAKEHLPAFEGIRLRFAFFDPNWKVVHAEEQLSRALFAVKLVGPENIGGQVYRHRSGRYSGTPAPVRCSAIAACDNEYLLWKEKAHG